MFSGFLITRDIKQAPLGNLYQNRFCGFRLPGLQNRYSKYLNYRMCLEIVGSHKLNPLFLNDRIHLNPETIFPHPTVW